MVNLGRGCRACVGTSHCISLDKVDAPVDINYQSVSDIDQHRTIRIISFSEAPVGQTVVGCRWKVLLRLEAADKGIVLFCVLLLKCSCFCDLGAARLPDGVGGCRGAFFCNQHLFAYNHIYRDSLNSIGRLRKYVLSDWVWIEQLFGVELCQIVGLMAEESRKSRQI